MHSLHEKSGFSVRLTKRICRHSIFLQPFLQKIIEMKFESSSMESQLYEHREVTLPDLEETRIWDNRNDTVRSYFISFLEFCNFAVSVKARIPEPFLP